MVVSQEPGGIFSNLAKLVGPVVQPFWRKALGFIDVGPLFLLTLALTSLHNLDLWLLQHVEMKAGAENAEANGLDLSPVSFMSDDIV